MTGGRPSLFHTTRLLTHSTASFTPDPRSALTGSTRLSRIMPPFSPSKTFLTKPSLILTTSSESSRSCLFARTSIGIPAVSSSQARSRGQPGIHRACLGVNQMLAYQVSSVSWASKVSEVPHHRLCLHNFSSARASLVFWALRRSRRFQDLYYPPQTPPRVRFCNNLSIVFSKSFARLHPIS